MAVVFVATYEPFASPKANHQTDWLAPYSMFICGELGYGINDAQACRTDLTADDSKRITYYIYIYHIFSRANIYIFNST